MGLFSYFQIFDRSEKLGWNNSRAQSCIHARWMLSVLGKFGTGSALVDYE